MIFIRILLISLLLILSLEKNVQASRAIPDDHLSHAVLITLDGDSNASGFYLNHKNNYIYLISAKHVFYSEKKDGAMKLKGNIALLSSYSKEVDWGNPIRLVVDLNQLNENNDIKYSLSQDIVAIKIATITEDGKGKIIEGVKKITKGSILSVPLENTKKFDDVLIGNDVYISGYPTSLGIKKLPQLDLDKPLLRKGIVAGKNEKQKTIILDCPVYYGNSGGPVVETEQISITRKKFLVIGIISQFVPFTEEWLNLKHRFTNIQIENSGYSIVVPIDPILELLEESENVVDTNN